MPVLILQFPGVDGTPRRILCEMNPGSGDFPPDIKPEKPLVDHRSPVRSEELPLVYPPAAQRLQRSADVDRLVFDDSRLGTTGALHFPIAVLFPIPASDKKKNGPNLFTGEFHV